jgi:hypothetical protein
MARATIDEPGTAGRSLPRRLGARFLHEFRNVLPPTIFFFVGFNLIVLTTNLLVAQYSVAVSNFMLATVAALVVGKAVLVANNLPFVKTFDRAPLIQPILFKTAFYWVVVFVARLIERFVHFVRAGDQPVANFGSHLVDTFSWHRFVAISLWLVVLFFIYVTAVEFIRLFGAAEMRRLMFLSRPSEFRLTRSQRIRELLRLSRLADANAAETFRDPASPARRELDAIVERIARTPT